MSLPTKREFIIVACGTILFFLLTGIFIGIRTDHVALMGLFLALFFASGLTRKLAIALIPFMVFAISYDWMRVFPNYEVNPIDVKGLYEAEKALFGIHADGQILTPNEYFAIHNCKLMDFLSGIFYLCWVPVPMLFGVWLYLKGERALYLRFALVFLLVNLIGFAGYYIHPAAPPWYVMLHGFEPVLNTPGETAGLARFDAVIGLDIFGSIYSRNANVFAAVPSLHSAYMIMPVYYSLIRKSSPWLVLLFSIILVGIWFTAVYTAHHYIIDVLLGILCAILGILLFEKGLLHIRGFRRFFDSYCRYIR